MVEGANGVRPADGVFAATATFTNANLMERLKAFCARRNIDLVNGRGLSLARLKPQELASVLEQSISTGTFPSAAQRFFALLGEIEESCQDLPAIQSKRPLKIPLADLVRLQNRDDRRIYFGAMPNIILVARRLDTEYSITLETKVNSEPGEEETEKGPPKIALLRVADRKSLMPLLDHLKELAERLSPQCRRSVTVSDIKVSLQMWGESQEPTKWLGQAIDLDTMLLEIVR